MFGERDRDLVADRAVGPVQQARVSIRMRPGSSCPSDSHRHSAVSLLDLSEAGRSPPLRSHRFQDPEQASQHGPLAQYRCHAELQSKHCEKRGSREQSRQPVDRAWHGQHERQRADLGCADLTEDHVYSEPCGEVQDDADDRGGQGAIAAKAFDERRPEEDPGKGRARR